MPDGADYKTERDYVYCILAEYKKRDMEWVNEEMKEFFKGDFAKFTLEMFRMLPKRCFESYVHTVELMVYSYH